MRESGDQPAAMAIAPDEPETNAQAQPPATVKAKMRRRKASAAEKQALPKSDEPDAAPAGKAPGLPVPVAILPPEEPTTADGRAIGRSVHASDPAPAFEAEAASAPRAASAEARLNSNPFRTLPPRQKKAGSILYDIWFKAAAVAVALGLGWIIGANAFDRSEDVRQLAVELHATQAKLADVTKAARAGPEADLAAVKTDLAALKKSVDGLGKGLDGQRAGLATTKANLESTRGDLESIKTALQAAQASFDAAKPDPVKLDRLAERIDRLEHQISSLMPTGAIPSASTAPPAARQSLSDAEKDPRALPGKDQRAAVEVPKIPPNGYVLRDVHNGVAIIEDRTGLHEVFPGEVLAGVGRIESIERRGRRWVVVTSNGLIDSDPY